jgi:hypothetical protein
LKAVFCDIPIFQHCVTGELTMSVALLTVPIVGTLAWLVLVALGVWRHHGAVAQRRQAAEQFRSRVLKDGERLDADLIEQLLDAPRPDEVLRDYCTRRAALLPGLTLETPAAWQIADLDKQVTQHFQTEVTQERRHFWTFIVVSLAGSLATIWIVCAVLYHFQSDSGQTAGPGIPNSLPTFTDSSSRPQADPTPSSAFDPSTSTNPAPANATSPDAPSSLSPVPAGAAPKSDEGYPATRDSLVNPPVTSQPKTDAVPSSRHPSDRTP